MYSYTRLESLPLCNDNTCVRCLRNNVLCEKWVFQIIANIYTYLIVHFALTAIYYIIIKPYSAGDIILVFIVCPSMTIISFIFVKIGCVMVFNVIKTSIWCLCTKYKEAGAEIAREKATAAYSNNQ